MDKPLDFAAIERAAAILNAAPVSTEKRTLLFPNWDAYAAFCRAQGIEPIPETEFVQTERLPES